MPDASRALRFPLLLGGTAAVLLLARATPIRQRDTGPRRRSDARPDRRGGRVIVRPTLP